MTKIKNLLSKIRYIFNRKEKIQLLLLLFAIALTTVLELLGVVAIMPFVNVVMDPNTIEKTPYLKWLYEWFDFQTMNMFIALLGVILILIYIIKNLCVTYMYYLQYAFTFNTQKKLCERMLNCYLTQPYIFHLQNNSADLIRNINTDVMMMFQAVISMLGLLAELAVCGILGIYLLIQDKSIAIGVVAVFTVFILLFAKPYKRYLTRIGEEDRDFSAGIVKWLHQSFGGMKETKVAGKEAYFLKHFNENYGNWADREKMYRLLHVAPRPVMEMVCVSALLGIIVLKLLNGTQSAYFVSTVSVFAVAAFRLLPSINRIVSNYGVVTFNMPAFDAVYQDLKEIEHLQRLQRQEKHTEEAMVFAEEIRMENLSFSYPDAEEKVLDCISLTIKKNQSVALIGPSGAGKTTLADILLGVLKPTQGILTVDGVKVEDNPSGWRDKLGYIPQSIYLMDDTIRGNILYGNEEADEKRLLEVLEEAQLKEFVNSLENGLDTVIGENGIRLSGGQRQRIGIARALYSNPEVLVLDEATSALDNETEEAVMEAINRLAGSKTLIIIAHRLSTTEKCDVIYEVKERKVTRVKG